MKKPTLGMSPWAAPSERVFKIKCSYCRSWKKPTLGMNTLTAPSVTLSFQNQVLLLKKHEKTHTRDEPFGCSQCDFEFSKSSALIEEA